MAKMLTLAAASGTAIEARIPVKVKSRGPSTFKQRHAGSTFWTPTGTHSAGQTIESSSGVLVTEKKSFPVAQAGTAEPAGQRTTA